MTSPFEHPLIAEVYDAIPSHQTRPDVAFYTRLATESAGCVLELGSGTGRVLIDIAKAGKTVVGLEASDVREYGLAYAGETWAVCPRR